MKVKCVDAYLSGICEAFTRRLKQCSI